MAHIDCGHYFREKKSEKADRIFRFAKYAVLFYFIIFVWSGVTAVKTAGLWQVFGQYVSFGHWPGLKPLLSVGGILLLVIFIGSLFVQRFFCRYFCPMGAIYSLISQASFPKIDKPRDGCGKCHLCTSKCPMGMDLTKKRPDCRRRMYQLSEVCKLVSERKCAL